MMDKHVTAFDLLLRPELLPHQSKPDLRRFLASIPALKVHKAVQQRRAELLVRLLIALDLTLVESLDILDVGTVYQALSLLGTQPHKIPDDQHPPLCNTLVHALVLHLCSSSDHILQGHSIHHASRQFVPLVQGVPLPTSAEMPNLTEEDAQSSEAELNKALQQLRASSQQTVKLVPHDSSALHPKAAAAWIQFQLVKRAFFKGQVDIARDHVQQCRHLLESSPTKAVPRLVAVDPDELAGYEAALAQHIPDIDVPTTAKAMTAAQWSAHASSMVTSSLSAPTAASLIPILEALSRVKPHKPHADDLDIGPLIDAFQSDDPTATASMSAFLASDIGQLLSTSARERFFQQLGMTSTLADTPKQSDDGSSQVSADLSEALSPDRPSLDACIAELSCYVKRARVCMQPFDVRRPLRGSVLSQLQQQAERGEQHLSSALVLDLLAAMITAQQHAAAEQLARQREFQLVATLCRCLAWREDTGRGSDGDEAALEDMLHQLALPTPPIRSGSSKRQATDDDDNAEAVTLSRSASDIPAARLQLQALLNTVTEEEALWSMLLVLCRLAKSRNMNVLGTVNLSERRSLVWEQLCEFEDASMDQDSEDSTWISSTLEEAIGRVNVCAPSSESFLVASHFARACQQHRKSVSFATEAARRQFRIHQQLSPSTIDLIAEQLRLIGEHALAICVLQYGSPVNYNAITEALAHAQRTDTIRSARLSLKECRHLIFDEAVVELLWARAGLEPEFNQRDLALVLDVCASLYPVESLTS